MTRSLPGSVRHQAILRTILDAYADDASIQTIGVFGSSARPEGDAYSDLDVDVTLPGEAMASARGKIQHLIAQLNASPSPVLLVAWDGDNAAEILLKSFDRIDITFHPPEDSKAEVLRDLIMLRGERTSLPVQGKPAIAPDAIEVRLRRLHAKFPILALEVAASVRRGRRWDAVNLLDEMRRGLMEIYGLSRGSTLPVRYFARQAEADAQYALGGTLATFSMESIVAGLKHLVDLYRAECVRWSNGRLAITPAHTAVFDHLTEWGL
jgi:predicted nucleotidyltransferase